MMVSTTDFSEEHYGKDFIDDYKRRLGVSASPGSTVTVLRSTTMAPWLLASPEGSILDVLELELRDAICYRDNEIDEFLTVCDMDRSGTVSLDEFLSAFSQLVAKAKLSGAAARA